VRKLRASCALKHAMNAQHQNTTPSQAITHLINKAKMLFNQGQIRKKKKAPECAAPASKI